MKLAFLQDLYEYSGPFATVYLDTSGDAEDASKAVELRWRSAREQLTERGVDEQTLNALQDFVAEHEVRSGHRGNVLVATQGEVVFHDELPQPPTQFSDDELVTVGPIPHLMPYLHLRQTRIPHVVAMVDSVGADIRVVGMTRAAGSSTVEGGQSPHRKSHTAGEGNEKRHHNAVEEQWKSNADDIADQITKHVRENGAEAVVLAGDVQLRTLVQERLRKGVQELVVDTAASHRGRNAVDEALESDIAAAVESALEERIRQTIDEFEQQRGNDSHAVEGWQATVEALQRGQVQTVLWAITPVAASEGGTLSIGPGASQVAFDDATLTESGAAWIDYVRADEAILRAAVGTHADFVLVDSDKVELTDGIGALLRFTTESTGS